MHRVGKLLLSVGAAVLFFFSWSVFYADGRLLHHPIAAWSFFIGTASAFTSVYTRLKERACLVGFATLAVAALLYNLVQGAPVFAVPVIFVLAATAGALPFGAGYLIGYWLAMGGRIIAHKYRHRAGSQTDQESESNRAV